MVDLISRRGRAATGEPQRPGTAVTPAGSLWRHLPEAGLVTLLAAALTALCNLPMLRALSTAVPRDTGDPLYFAWQLSWVGHALLDRPLDLYSPDVYQGATNNLAYTDVILGYAPLAWMLGSGPEAAVRLVNIAVLVAIATSFVGAHALARVLGADLLGALVAGAGFAFAPWRLGQITHVNVMSTGVAALAVAALCLGHGWSLRDRWEPGRVRPGWILTGWLLATWQLSFGFAVGVIFGYVLAVVVGAGLLTILVRVVHSPEPTWPQVVRLRPMILAEGVGAAVFGVAGLILTRPYFWVVEHFPEARRDEGWLFLSPPWRAFLTAPDSSVVWGGRQASWRADLPWVGEMVLLPGFVLIGLAVLGLLVSSWPLRRRLGLLVTTAVLTVLAMGIRFPGEGRWTFLPLYHHLPGWDALRTPGRLVIWVTLLLCLLAAGLVTRLVEVVSDPDGRFRLGAPVAGGPVRRVTHAGLASVAAALLVVPAGLVTAEGYGRTPMVPVTFPRGDLNSLSQPVLVLPNDLFADYRVMAWQTDGWPVMANGNSGFDSKDQSLLREQVRSFPAPDSVAALRARGVRTVVVPPAWAVGSPWADAATRPVDYLGITRRQVDDLIVFDLGQP